MDRLYASSGSCSLAAAVLLEECSHKYELHFVELYPDGAGDAELCRVNPLRQVPVLLTEQGVLTEVLAISLYLDQRHPEATILPRDDWERVQCFRWLSFLGGTLLMSFRPLIRPERFVGPDPDHRALLRRTWTPWLLSQLAVVEDQLGTRPWLASGGFSAADALLHVLFGLAKMMKLPLGRLRRLEEHFASTLERPKVAAARERHGVVPKLVS